MIASRLQATLTVALVTLALVSGSHTAASQSESTIGILAIDVNVEGNTATLVGPLDGCARVEVGGQTSVDYIVKSIPPDRPMIAFEAEIRYNPQLVEVVGLDHDLLLAAAGTYSPFAALTDDIPDSDGNLRISVLDTASTAQPEANVERGEGVLARITFLGKAQGVTEIAVVVAQEPTPVYPLVQDTQNRTVYAEMLGRATLAVGQDCLPQDLEPDFTNLAQVNEAIQGGGGLQVGGSPSPADEAPSPEPGASPDGQDGGAQSTSAACITSELQDPTPDPTPAPAPGETPAPPPETPTPRPPAPCTPAPTPVEDDIVDVESDSDTVFIIGALALLTAGTAATGGGWYLLRRSGRKAEEGSGPPEEQSPG